LFVFSGELFQPQKMELNTISSSQAKIKCFKYREIADLEKIYQMQIHLKQNFLLTQATTL